MPDAGAGAHDLNASRFYSAFVAETISVSDCTFTDIGDDLDIGMHPQRKARVWRDLFVVPNAHAAPATSRWIILRAGGKVTPGFEPAEVFAWELVERPAFNHRHPQSLTLRGGAGVGRESHREARRSRRCPVRGRVRAR